MFNKMARAVAARRDRLEFERGRNVARLALAEDSARAVLEEGLERSEAFGTVTAFDEGVRAELNAQQKETN